jgi:hypothetical protein
LTSAKMRVVCGARGAINGSARDMQCCDALHTIEIGFSSESILAFAATTTTSLCVSTVLPMQYGSANTLQAISL